MSTQCHTRCYCLRLFLPFSLISLVCLLAHTQKPIRERKNFQFNTLVDGQLRFYRTQCTLHIDLDERAFDLPEQRRNESVPNDLKSITIEVNNRFDLVSIRSSNTCAECLKILANGFQFSYQ